MRSTLFRQARAEFIAVRLNLAEFGLVKGLILQIDPLLGNFISLIIIEGSSHFAAEHSTGLHILGTQPFGIKLGNSTDEYFCHK